MNKTGSLLMNNTTLCKGCPADVNISEQQIHRILAALELKDFECVSDETYRERLSACLQCPSLQYGTTCQFCGCIVHIRAKLAEKRCPMPGTPKW